MAKTKNLVLNTSLSVLFHENVASEMSMSKHLDPSAALKFADYFLHHNKHDKAVSMLIAAKKHEDALSVCMTYGVAITEEMADKLTPPKSDDAENEGTIL